jgi:cyclophilin family peptidyl-prolyl cis-trans isomerase/protein-disulfide isomerase
MKHKAFLAILVLLFVLSACSTPVTPTVVQSPLNLSTPTVAATPTAQGESTPASPTASVNPTFIPTTQFTASPAASCQVVQAVPTPTAEVVSLIESDTVDSRSMGPKNARFVIDVFSDFQCPYCAGFAPEVYKLTSTYPNDLRVVYHYLPLSSIHDKATLAAQGAEAAARQGYFWAMHDAIFASQSQWQSMSIDDFTTWLQNQAKSLGMNTTKFATDLKSQDVIKAVNDSAAVAAKLNLTSTPSVIVNRLLRSSRNDVATISSYLDYIKLGDKAATTCPPMSIDPKKQYTATLKTEKGAIVIALYPDKAPWAVNSFVHLAQSGWYQGSGFFRVITGYLAQAGDPSNTGLGTPGYQYSNEVTPDLRFDKAGMVGMANAGADTNGAQFFITYAPIPNLDGKYTVFGEVISGMDVLQTIRPRNPNEDAILFAPDPILSITIEEK